ncbi:hypothetical protein KUTeg_005949 [Tegillarca granosa]|uniref:VWA7 N-terminal domain-containing protein n=1 Tax=Tegillarca granosa TaxID=220873 RepID=A0ABQ9FF59_TEGGR|nr:hypothetical protein KUTeg_005949 [Tegillarca granosa]
MIRENNFNKSVHLQNIVYFTWCDAFLPTNFGAKETDFSHKSITENAVNKASALYIAKFLKPGVYNDTDLNEMKVIHEFFGHDTASLKDYLNVVGYLVYGNNNAQRQYGANAMYTMNAEQIENGNLLLENKRDTIIRLAKSPNPDWNFIRLTIGEFLMTLQMFYSNTNWIELKGLKVNTALGILSLLKIIIDEGRSVGYIIIHQSIL